MNREHLGWDHFAGEDFGPCFGLDRKRVFGQAGLLFGWCTCRISTSDAPLFARFTELISDLLFLNPTPWMFVFCRSVQFFCFNHLAQICSLSLVSADDLIYCQRASDFRIPGDATCFVCLSSAGDVITLEKVHASSVRVHVTAFPVSSASLMASLVV